MVRRKKRSRPKHTEVQGQEALARAAAEHLACGRFKDAVADYKRLVKEERRPQWLDGLARSYAGRAEQLACRGMVKEAIALWQNRAAACAESLADPRYLEWLLAAGRGAEAVRLYRQDSETLAGAEGVVKLRARLAAAALANGGELLEQLPGEDPIACDFAAAEAALVAYAGGDEGALETALQRIPFRSPYRDFRQLLKALVLHEQAPDAALDLLARVPADTPFAGLRAALEAAGRCPEVALAALPAQVLELVAALKGWDSEQVQLLASLARLGPSPGRKELFDFIVVHRSTLGEPFAREAAFAVAGDDRRLHRRLIGVYEAWPALEQRRRVARLSEAHEVSEQAAKEWQRLLEALALEPDCEDNRLRRALIHRHIADLIEPPPANPPLNPKVVEHLECSLELDPEARDSSLRLIDHYLYVRNLKAARKWVDQVLKQYPDDAESLFKAAQTAVAGGAYKKAAGFGHRLLAIDPINPRVRGLLVDAYIAHAGKQAKAGKAAAGRRELDQAEQWARSAVDEGRIQILRALTVLAEEGSDAASQALKAGIERAGGGLVGRFYLLLEADRVGHDLQAVTRVAALPAARKAGEREQVLALVRAVGALREGLQQTKAVEAALRALAPAIDRAADSKLTREEVELVCETLLRYRCHNSLKRHAQAALRRWPRAPLFVFYRTQGQWAGRTPKPWTRDFRQLESAFERARMDGDMRTAQRIETFLSSAFPDLPRFEASNPFLDDDEFGSDEPGTLEEALDSAVWAVLERILGQPDLRRAQDALEQGKPLPRDIAAKLEAALLGGGEGIPVERKSAPKKRKGKKRCNKGDTSQGDLFGDAK
ncbi:MAG: hypothetical protein L0H63_08150 [Nitrococcus sp.]|nr:hypothetical protein [Nitrococcus sp.]